MLGKDTWYWSVWESRQGSGVDCIKPKINKKLIWTFVYFSKLKKKNQFHIVCNKSITEKRVHKSVYIKIEKKKILAAMGKASPKESWCIKFILICKKNKIAWSRNVSFVCVFAV